MWIDNERGDYEYWNEQAQECYDNAEAEKSFTRDERAALALADQLKDFFEENTPTVKGFYADILNSALSEVNWCEIAKAIVTDEVEKEETTEVA